MKVGRYELGYWFLMIALIAAMLPFAKIITQLPDWLSIVLFAILFFGFEALYSAWYVKRTCKSHLRQWIEQHGFSYKVKSDLFSSAHIQGMYHNRPVHIELRHALKDQFTRITCKVDNERNVFASINKRGFLGRFFQTVSREKENAFENVYGVDASAPEFFSGDNLRNRLVEIQTALDVINSVKLERDEVTLTYRGMLTNTEKLEGALEAVALVADAADLRTFHS